MTDEPKDLLARAIQHIPTDKAVRECWNFIIRGIELGWLDRNELRSLQDHLRDHRDFGVEELLFAHLGDRLRVSFLDQQVTCSPLLMLEALTSFEAF